MSETEKFLNCYSHNICWFKKKCTPFDCNRIVGLIIETVIIVLVSEKVNKLQVNIGNGVVSSSFNKSKPILSN